LVVGPCKKRKCGEKKKEDTKQGSRNTESSRGNEGRRVREAQSGLLGREGRR